MNNTKFNAVVKKVSFDNRLTIPAALAGKFNLSHSVYIMPSADKTAITLTQKCTKKNSSKISSSINANANGVLQMTTTRYFKNNSNVVIYSSSKDSVTVKSL